MSEENKWISLAQSKLEEELYEQMRAERRWHTIGKWNYLKDKETPLMQMIKIEEVNKENN